MTLALASRKRSRLTPGRALRGLQFFLQALDLFPQPRIFPLYTLLVLQRLIPFSRARRSSCASSLIRRMGLSDLRNKPYSKPKRYFCSVLSQSPMFTAL